MKRLELIQQLEKVQENIEVVQRRLAQPMPAYYALFNKCSEWRHKKEVWLKCLMFWKRKFNNILSKLSYHEA